MHDETENARRARIGELNQLTHQIHAAARPSVDFTAEQDAELRLFRELEAQYGKVWDTQGLRQDFTVHGFLAPFVVVTEKATGKKGTLEFTHSPRAYFNWQEDWKP
jgi:hypothetical protein